MFESLLTSILNRVLSDYVSNLEHSQLSVAIWKGNVVLNNLELRPDALNKLELPITVVQGHLGELTMQIPWKNLKNKPVKIQINDLFMLAAPVDPKYNADLEAKIKEKIKKDQIENAELLITENIKKTSPNSDSFFNQLVTKIVDNIQVKISRIHIRYEDLDYSQGIPSTIPSDAFSFGITLKELSSVSTDENWNEAFVSDKIIRKKVELDSLGAYWNTNDLDPLGGQPLNVFIEKNLELLSSKSDKFQYLLNPVSGATKVTIHKDAVDQKSLPKTSVKVLFEDITLDLQDRQFSQFLKWFENMLRIVKSRKFHKFKPKGTLYGPKEMWQYSGMAILDKIHQKNLELSPSRISLRRKNRLQYIQLFKKKLNAASTFVSAEEKKQFGSEQENTLKNMENSLSALDIISWRKLARTEWANEHPEPEAAKSAYSYITSWWYGENSSSSKACPVVTDTDMAQLYEVIGFDGSGLNLETGQTSLDLNVILKRGSFVLSTEAKNDQLDLIYEDLIFSMNNKTNAASLSISLSKLELQNKFVPSSLFPTLVQAKSDKYALFNSNNTNTSEVPFFQLYFEKFAESKNSFDSKLDVKMTPLVCILNRSSFNNQITSFYSTINSERIDNIMASSQVQLDHLKLLSRSGLEFAIESHKSMDINIDLDAPVIYFPESITNPNSFLFVADLGYLTLRTAPLDSELKDSILAKKTQLSAEDMDKLKTLAFEKYNIGLTRLSIFWSPTIAEYQKRLQTPTKDFYLVEEIDLSLLLRNCIDATALELPKLSIQGSLNAIDVAVTDVQYKAIMKLLSINFPSENDFQSEKKKRNSNQSKITEFHPVVMQSDMFYDASDSVETLQRLEKVEDDCEKLKRIFLELSFSIQRMSLLLSKGEDLKISHSMIDNIAFGLKIRDLWTSLHLSLQNFIIFDLFQEEKWAIFQFQSFASKKDNSDETFLELNLDMVDSQHPEFLYVWDKTNLNIKLNLRSINARLSPDCILRQQKYLLETFVDSSSSSNSSDLQEVKKDAPNPSSLLVKINLNNFILDLYQDSEHPEFLNVNIEDSNILYHLSHDNAYKLNANLGNFNVNYMPLINEAIHSFLYCEEGNLLSLSYSNDSSNANAHLSVKTSSFIYTFIPSALHDMLDFINKARIVSVNTTDSSTSKSVPTGPILFLDISLSSPIVVIPFSLKDETSIVLHLGDLILKNSFAGLDQSIDIQLSSINIGSIFKGDGSNVMSASQKILSDTSLSCTVNIFKNHSSHSEILLSIGKARIIINNNQYSLLLKTLFWVQATVPEILSKLPSKGEVTQESTLNSSEEMKISAKFDGLELSLNGNNGDSLSMLKIEGIQLAGTLTNTIAMALGISSVSVKDTRAIESLQFRNVLQNGNNDASSPIITISYSKTDFNSDIVKVDMASPRIVLSVDFIILLLNFFKVELSEFKETPNPKVTIPNSEQPKMFISLCISDIFIYLLESNKSKSSEAIALHAHRFNIAQQGNTSCVLEKISGFFCNMDKIDETRLCCIEDFDALLTLEADAEMSSIWLKLSPIISRLSLQDIKLIQDIYNQSFGFMNEGSASNANDQPTEIIKAITQSLQFELPDFQLLLVDDLSDVHMPLFSVQVHQLIGEICDWSFPSIKGSTRLNTSIDFFNTLNSSWEPVLEKWPSKIEICKSEPNENSLSSLNVSFLSNEFLNIVISKSLLCSVYRITDLIAEASKMEKMTAFRPMSSPYVIQNNTGLLLEISDESGKSKAASPKSSLEWSFFDWKELRLGKKETVSNRITVSFPTVKQYLSVPNIPIDEACFKTFPFGKGHKIGFEVSLKNNQKIVNIRSEFLIKNETVFELELLVESETIILTPNSTHPISNTLLDTVKIKIRPRGQACKWSEEFLSWKRCVFLAQKGESKIGGLFKCFHESEKGSSFHFYAHIKMLSSDKQKYMNIKGSSSFFTVHITAPMELANCLPFDIRYKFFDKTAKFEWSGGLKAGATIPIHNANLENMIALSICTNGFVGSNQIYVHSPDDFQDDTLSLVDADSAKLDLNLEYEQSESGSKKIYISSPYILLNYTGLPLIFKSASFIGNSKLAAGQVDAPREKLTPGHRSTPILFSFSSDVAFKRRRALVKIQNSDWSKPLSFNAIGSSIDFELLAESKVFNIGMSIEGGSGVFSRSTIVSFSPRYMLVNSLNNIDLEYRTESEKKVFTLKSNEQTAIHISYKNSTEYLNFKRKATYDEWSTSVKIDCVGKSFVKLKQKVSAETTLISVNVFLQKACMFVVIEEANDWPYRVVNRSKVDIHVYQKEVNSAYRVPKGSSIPFCWDQPTYDKVLLLNVCGKEREVDIAEVGQVKPISYSDPHTGEKKVLTLSVSVDGPTFVLTVEESNVVVARKSIFGSANSSQLVLPNEAPVDTFFNFIFEIKLPGIGISLIKESLEELCYISLRNITVDYRDSNLLSTYGLTIKWIQIDNQLLNAPSPVIFFPTSIGMKEDDKDAFKFAIIQSKNSFPNFSHYKYLGLSIQEFTLDIYEDFLLEIRDLFAKKDECELATKSNESNSLQTLLEEKQSLTLLSQDKSLLFFEFFQIHPIKINVTFSISENRNENTFNMLSLTGNFLSMTIGNITDAPIKLNALILENPIISQLLLISLIQKHYSQAVIQQMHKIIGSADFLGNPVGLFTSFSSGVGDLFYEPLNGFVSDKPSDIGIGFVKGGASLVKKTVFGISESLSKFTGSIGKGFSAATMDAKYQATRRQSRIRNKPRHALTGVAAGTKSLLTSVSSGITGIVERPFEGAKESGVGGFFKGVGKGLIGAVTKPVVGVFDLASTVTEGIKNTTTVLDEEIDRLRPPRVIPADGVIKPYSLNESVAQAILRTISNGRYCNDYYVAHAELSDISEIIIVSTQRCLEIDSKKLKIIWEIPFNDLKEVLMISDEIHFYQNEGKIERIRIAETEIRKHVYNKVKNTLQYLSNIAGSE